MEKSQIQNLLQHVGLIRKKYKDFEEITGENFNVFDILNVSTNEMSHSSFVCFLLDTKAKHGQKDLFLKLFLEQIKNQFENEKNDILIQFDTINSYAITEKSIGYKSDDVSNGGRIDIIINDGKNNIIIENKIYAGDQEKQMMRYHNYDPNAPLIYLSLGDETPSEDSISHSDKKLELNKDFISISYKSDIKKWIEECIKSVYDKPLIRETLRQYVFLINELTNQSNNKKMSEEILEIMKRNLNESFDINDNFEKLKDKLFFDFIEKVKVKLEGDEIYLNLNAFKRDVKDNEILIQNKNWKGTDFRISIYCENKELFIGLWDSKIDQKIKEMEIQNIINVFQINDGKYNNWYIYGKWKYFIDYKLKSFWLNILDENFTDQISNSIIELVKICDEKIFLKIYKHSEIN